MTEHCHITEEQINALVDGEMPEREQRMVAAHVTGCEHCSAVAGAVLAGKRLVGARPVEAEPPHRSWERVVSTLDQVDGLARATRPSRRAAAFGGVPALAACGILLIAAAVMWQARQVRPAAQCAVFVKNHLAAISTVSHVGAAPRDIHDVVTARTATSEWVPSARWILPLDGEFADHTLFRVDDRCPVSEFVVSSRSFDPTGLTRVQWEGGDYWVHAERGGSIVAWSSAGVTHVLVARTNPNDLMSLAVTRKMQAPMMKSL